jgi:acetyl esterase/lipase
LIKTLKVPASSITISGDSAGGNLALTLLRYVAVHGEEVGLPSPGCIWLWSPWVDLEAARDPKNISQSAQYSTDYLGTGFGAWGVNTFCPQGKGIDGASPWISPLNNPFETKTPIWIQTGDAEILYDDNVKIAEQFKGAGNKVGLEVTKGVPHDIILVGVLIGFTEEAAEAAKKAGEFLRTERARL